MGRASLDEAIAIALARALIAAVRADVERERDGEDGAAAVAHEHTSCPVAGRDNEHRT